MKAQKDTGASAFLIGNGPSWSLFTLDSDIVITDMGTPFGASFVVEVVCLSSNIFVERVRRHPVALAKSLIFEPLIWYRASRFLS